MVHNHRRQHDHHHVKRAAAAEPQNVEVVSKFIESVGDRVQSKFASVESRLESIRSVVYVTASQTFQGKPAGYITVNPFADDETPTTKAPTKPSSATSAPPVTTKAAAPTTSAAPKKPVKEEEEEKEEEEVKPKKTKEEEPVEKAKTTPVQTTLQTIKTPAASIPSELDTPSTSTDVFGANVASATSTGGSVSSISASPEASSSGLSAGATGGLIGGGIALLLIALAFAGFLYRRKQQKVMQEAYGKPEDEKFGMASAAAPMGGAGAAASFNEKHHSQASSFASHTPAPQQLQVRVVSQFAPILNVDQGSYQPSSNANGLIAPGAALAAAAVVAAKPQEPAVPVKRFSYQERAEQVQARRQSQQMLAQQQQQFQAPQQFGQQPQQQFQPQQAPAPFVPVPMTYQRPAPKPVNVPAIAIPEAADFAPPMNPFASNTPSSPSVVDLATPTTPGTPTVLAAGAAAGAALPVYRVIMEFKPSMGDEIELIPGDLVRLMHEYDDGWALCSRMNGSHQGVCPRTCLSPRPVKPRPRNGTVGSQSGAAPFSPVTGPNNGSRPGTPTGMRGPQQPQAQQTRPQTPTGMRQPPLAKPATPTQYKAFTPSSRPSTPKIQSRPQTPTGQRSNQATPQSSPPRIKEPVAPSSPIVPSILVSPSDEQPASPILGPVKVESAVKVPSPLAKEEKAEDVKTESS